MNTAFTLLLESGNTISRLQELPAKEQLSAPDYWSTVGIISLMGILVVFLILAILIFFFWLMGLIFKAIDKSKSEKKAAAEPAKAAPAPVAEPVSEVYDDEEIIAVISAAIAAYAESEGTSYTITGIKKHRDNRARSAWSTAGINENINRF